MGDGKGKVSVEYVFGGNRGGGEDVVNMRVGV